MNPNIQDSPVDTGRSGNWWIATLVSLMVTISVCVLMLVTAHDFFACMERLYWLVFFWPVPALVCLTLATISFVKKEKHNASTNIVALSGFALLALGLVVYVRALCLGLLFGH